MRILLISLWVLYSSLNIVIAQKAKTPFIRIYDSVGHKIAKGYLYNTTDSSIYVQLRYNDSITEIKYSSMALIKKGRSTGHIVLTSTAITTAILGTFGYLAATRDGFFSTGDGLAIVGATAVTGAAVGGIISGLKQPQSIKIEKVNSSWKSVTEQLGFWLK